MPSTTADTLTRSRPLLWTTALLGHKCPAIRPPAPRHLALFPALWWICVVLHDAKHKSMHKMQGKLVQQRGHPEAE